MAVPFLTEDLNIISKLGDKPNESNGLTADQLKAKFDAAPGIIKTYINEILVPALLAAIESVGDSEERLDENEESVRDIRFSLASLGETVAANKAEAVQKAGDTMTGPLDFRSDSPEIRFSNGSGEMKVKILPDVATGGIKFIFYPDGATDFYEEYELPVPASGLDANVLYKILTTKSPVAISEGGHGGETAEEARTNLGVPGKPVLLWSGTWSSGSLTVAESGGSAGCTGLGDLSDYYEFRFVTSDGVVFRVTKVGSTVRGGGAGYSVDYNGTFAYVFYAGVSGNTITMSVNAWVKIFASIDSASGQLGAIKKIYGYVKNSDIKEAAT